MPHSKHVLIALKNISEYCKHPERIDNAESFLWLMNSTIKQLKAHPLSNSKDEIFEKIHALPRISVKEIHIAMGMVNSQYTRFNQSKHINKYNILKHLYYLIFTSPVDKLFQTHKLVESIMSLLKEEEK